MTNESQSCDVRANSQSFDIFLKRTDNSQDYQYNYVMITQGCVMMIVIDDDNDNDDKNYQNYVDYGNRHGGGDPTLRRLLRVVF